MKWEINEAREEFIYNKTGLNKKQADIAMAMLKGEVINTAGRAGMSWVKVAVVQWQWIEKQLQEFHRLGGDSASYPGNH